MGNRKCRIALLALLLLVTCRYVQPQEDPQNNKESCLRFAQRFYSWYVMNAIRERKVAPWHVALKHYGDSFSGELTKALTDSDAEAKADGDPVLDFDPILNSQDPAENYVVRNVTQKDGRYWADVYGVWARPAPDQGKKPQVVAEMIFKDGRWIFLNFHYPNSTYPDSENLLSILRYQRHSQ